MKIFVSGTSTQFKTCRERLRSSLAKIGHEVRLQEDFQTGTGLLLKRIQDYIAACARVIVLVGDAYGSEATGDFTPCGDRHLWPRSWTQWEFYFARGERLDGRRTEARPLQVYFASEKFIDAHSVAEADDLKARQRAFTNDVKRTGQHWAPFDNEDALGRMVLEDIRQIEAHLPPPIDDATFSALSEVEDAVRNGRVASDDALASVRSHSPRNVREHWLRSVATWSHPKFAVDARFTRLTLMLDQGRDAEHNRWQEQPQSFDDLRAVLATATNLGLPPVLVLLGPPGSGKSTLLRRLEYDLAADAIRGQAGDDTWTFFVPLGSFSATGPSAQDPDRWLRERWAGDFPHLPAFDEVCRSGRLTLLLDALNEMPHKGREDYAARIDSLRTFIADLVRRSPHPHIVFSCRSLDYSELLSTPDLTVPQARIERLSDEQVRSFLQAYSPEHADRLWRQLDGTPQLDLFKSPYYLRLLIDQASATGVIPDGRAALFAGFVRRAIRRELQASHPLFRAGGVLDNRDRDRVVRNEWRTSHDLPDRGPLINGVSVLAFGLQERREGAESAQVRAPLGQSLGLLGPDRAEDLLAAGVALQVLDEDRARDEVLFVHQLLQEFFAARIVAARRPTDVVLLAHVPWREADVPPVRFESDNDPLPPAPATGWEETFTLAAAMAPDADAFVSALMPENIPLAGRAAAQPDVKISEALRTTMQQALLERSREPAADLRSRIAAARALGELGDPRFAKRRGPFGDYLWPPIVPVRGGTYTIGSDEHDADERPAHPVTIAPFSIGMFPVTNAEWRLFMLAGGYDDERWWDTPSAKAWRRGEGTAEGPKQRAREIRALFLKDPGLAGRLHQEGRITSRDVEGFEFQARMSDAEFEALLTRSFPAGRQSQPSRWSDPAFNHPAHPVVGICWHEARAYCTWLSAQTGVAVSLPSEAQWEAAARGTKGSRFAWGKTFDARRCNTFETHVRATTPIGVFPQGDTPSGLADMTGNVWDWTSSAYLDYPYVATDGREDASREGVRRVVRGGSWDNSQDFARASFRSGDPPVDRDDDVGFRVVVVSPIH